MKKITKKKLIFFLTRNKYHVISQIITNIQTLNFPILAQLLKQILIKILQNIQTRTKSNTKMRQRQMKKKKEPNLEVILDFVGVKRLSLIRVNDRGNHVGSLVHVWEKKGWADGGFGVEPWTTVAMSASSDLEVERAVNPILLGPKYRCQVLRHSYTTQMFNTKTNFWF